MKKSDRGGMSFHKICCIFCCPPWPPSIIAKLAFDPPSPSTYSFKPDATGFKYSFFLKTQDESAPTIEDLEHLDVFYTRTRRGNQIACMFMKFSSLAKYTILYSQPQSTDLGRMCLLYFELSSRTKCNVFFYDYSGYGESEGKPSERNVYADAEAAFYAAQERYGIRPENIILYGRSLGTVATIDLASKYEVGGVILIAPFTSGKRIFEPSTKRTTCCDPFPNIDKVPHITAPVLVVHGTDDEVIDIAHGKAVLEMCPRPVEPLWIEGAGHNDLFELSDHYIARFRKFINEELSTAN